MQWMEFLFPVLLALAGILTVFVRQRGNPEESEQALVEEMRELALAEEQATANPQSETGGFGRRPEVAKRKVREPGKPPSRGLANRALGTSRGRVAARERDGKLRPYIYPGKQSANRALKHRPSSTRGSKGQSAEAG